MDISSIELPGSEVEDIRIDGDQVVVRFSRAYIVKSMTGSRDKTRWWQAGELVFTDATAEAPYPKGPRICAGGDVGENVYTYRDMIPTPLDSRASGRWDDLETEFRALARHFGVDPEKFTP